MCTCVCAGGAGVPKAPQPGEVLGDQVAVNVGTVALHPRKSTATGTCDDSDGTACVE